MKKVQRESCDGAKDTIFRECRNRLVHTWYANDRNLVRDVGCGDGGNDIRGGSGGGGGDSGFLARSRAKRAFSSLPIFQHARTRKGFGFKWGAATPPSQGGSQPAGQLYGGEDGGGLADRQESSFKMLEALTQSLPPSLGVIGPSLPHLSGS